MNFKETREELAKKYDLDLSLIKQVFFISFENDSWTRYVNILSEIGDFKVNTFYGGGKTIDFAYVNTNLTLEELQEKINKIKPKKSKLAFMGLSLDTMALITDKSDREWCYQRQKETMDYIISKQQPKAVEILNNLINSMENQRKQESQDGNEVEEK